VHAQDPPDASRGVTLVVSPIALPLWWHPGSSFPETALHDIIQAWSTDRFDVLIFLHDDRTRIPGAILHAIDQNYRAVPRPARKPPSRSQIDVYLPR